MRNELGYNERAIRSIARNFAVKGVNVRKLTAVLKVFIKSEKPFDKAFLELLLKNFAEAAVYKPYCRSALAKHEDIARLSDKHFRAFLSALYARAKEVRHDYTVAYYGNADARRKMEQTITGDIPGFSEYLEPFLKVKSPDATL